MTIDAEDEVEVVKVEVEDRCESKDVGVEDRETFHEPEREMIPVRAVILRGFVCWAESMCANITGVRGRLCTMCEIQRDAIA